MIKELGPGLRLMVALTILTGLVYPAAMTAISKAMFPGQSKRKPGDSERQGSRIEPDRTVIHEARIFPSAALVRRKRLRCHGEQRFQPWPHQRQIAARNDQNRR